MSQTISPNISVSLSNDLVFLNGSKSLLPGSKVWLKSLPISCDNEKTNSEAPAATADKVLKDTLRWIFFYSVVLRVFPPLRKNI